MQRSVPPGLHARARRRIALTIAGAAVLAAALVGGSVFAARSLTAAPRPVPVTPAPRPQVISLSPRPSTSPSPSPSPTPTPVQPATAPCDPDAMLPVILAQVANAGPLPFQTVTITKCRNGYAWVSAHTSDPHGDSDMVILKDVDGTWQVVTDGTGLDCVSTPIAPEVKAACDALGM